MPVNKEGLYYVAGKQAFADGKDLADKPGQYLTNEWETGWIDALAAEVRAMKKP